MTEEPERAAAGRASARGLGVLVLGWLALIGVESLASHDFSDHEHGYEHEQPP